MIDGVKLAKYLHDTDLKIHEFWFLYAVMTCEDNFRGEEIKIPQTVDNKQFNEYIAIYFKRHKPAKGMKWSEVAYKLEDEGWLDTNQERKEALKLRSCRVTEQFKSYFMLSDANVAFTDFLERYPRWVYVKGTKYTTIDMSPDILAETYFTKILKKGNALLHERALLITEMFIRDNSGDAPYKISTYFERYEGIAMSYEAEFSGSVSKKSSTGRRAI